MCILLEERIRNPRLRKALRTYGIIGVIRRTSTSRPHTGDPRVLAALSLIRERAAKGPLAQFCGYGTETALRIARGDSPHA